MYVEGGGGRHDVGPQIYSLRTSVPWTAQAARSPSSTSSSVGINPLTSAAAPAAAPSNAADRANGSASVVANPSPCSSMGVVAAAFAVEVEGPTTGEVASPVFRWRWCVNGWVGGLDNQNIDGEDALTTKK